MFWKSESGCRAYVTFAGGIHIERTMGSKSTYIRAAIGGIEGRMLKKGDYFKLVHNQNGESFHSRHKRCENKTKWAISNSVLPKYKKHPKLRVITDFEYNQFTEKVERHFYERV